MWESLGSGPRQDRLLHGAAKALNVVLGFLMMPFWLGGQRLVSPARRLLERLDRNRGELPLPPAGDRSLDSLVAELQAIPHSLRPSRAATLRKGIADISMFILSQKRQTVNLGYSYPRQFEYHYFEGADGERIAAIVGVQDEARPGLVVVHGLLSSRLFDYVRRIAVQAYFGWGFNVLAIDLRSFGLTEMLTRAPGTGGWKEGEDILCAARYLKSLGSTSVGALGISLGASSVLNASHPSGAEVLDGGILAVCGPADTRAAVQHMDRDVPRGHPFYPVSRLFEAMLVSKVQSRLAERGRRLRHVDRARGRAALRDHGRRGPQALVGQEPHHERSRAGARAPR